MTRCLLPEVRQQHRPQILGSVSQLALVATMAIPAVMYSIVFIRFDRQQLRLLS
jgi:hypothetical protein